MSDTSFYAEHKKIKMTVPAQQKLPGPGAGESEKKAGHDYTISTNITVPGVINIRNSTNISELQISEE